MKFKREIVTPYLVFIFLIVGFSGVLMFFHLLDDYTNVVHEFLGLAFFLFAVLHIINNWKSVENYSKKQQLLIPGVVIVIISISFIVFGKIKGNLENDLLKKLVKAPIVYSFKVLDVQYNQAKVTLRKNNIIIKDSLQSIEDIGIKNQKSPEEIIELIIEK